jgi:hypothetical protein
MTKDKPAGDPPGIPQGGKNRRFNGVYAKQRPSNSTAVFPAAPMATCLTHCNQTSYKGGFLDTAVSSGHLPHRI